MADVTLDKLSLEADEDFQEAEERHTGFSMNPDSADADASPENPSADEAEAAAAHKDAAATQPEAPEGANEEEDDAFGDFEDSPEAAPVPAPALPAQPAAVAEDDDDGFGDFAESAPAAPVAPEPQPAPAPPASAASVQGLSGERLEKAVAKSWAAAFGSKGALPQLDEAERQQLLQQSQLAGSGALTVPNSTSILACGGLPLETTTPSTRSTDGSQQQPSSAGQVVYQPAIKCEHDLSWRNSSSETRLLKSLGLADVAAQARQLEEAAPVSRGRALQGAAAGRVSTSASLANGVAAGGTMAGAGAADDQG